MWSPEPGRRASLTAVGLLAVAVSGCLRPLYGPTASGQPLPAAMAAVEVEPVQAAIGQERLAHHLRSELVYNLDGSGQPAPKRYRLVLTTSERVQTPIVNSSTGRADSATIIVAVAYKLTAEGGVRIIAEGTAQSTASYDRTSQRFASVRAARDAEIRVAKVLAEQIKTRLATALLTGT